MNTFVVVLLVYGIFEICSNLFHFTRGSKIKIGESAKKQHQELPLDVSPLRFFYKAIIMFAFGILFTLSSVIYLLNPAVGLLLVFYTAILHVVYALIQLIVYRRCYKVWCSFVVYSLPLIVYWIIVTM